MSASSPRYTLRFDRDDLEWGELSDLDAPHVFEAEPRLGGHARTIVAGRRGDV